MKLVGATDWFIRWPFVIEGVVVGALGGIAAILLLAVVKVALVDPLASDFALIAAPDTMNFGLLIAVLLGAAVAVSALGLGAVAAPLPARLSSRLAHVATVSTVRRTPSLSCAVPGRLLRPAGRRASGSAGTRPRCPGPSRDALVDDDEGRLYDEALDTIADNYYRPVDRDALLNTASTGRRQVARRPLLQLLRPEGLQAASRRRPTGAFEGVGMNVEQADRGLRVADRVRRLARASRRGIKTGDLITARRTARSLAGQVRPTHATALIKGPAGHRGDARPCVRATTAARRAAASARRSTSRSSSPRCASVDGRKIAHVPLVELHLRRARRGARGGRAAARPGRRGHRARPARQRRRPAERGRAVTASIFVPDGTIVSTDGPRAPAGTCSRRPATRSTREIPVVVLVNRELGLGVGDRHRRAAGPRARRGRRHAHVRQGRLPGDPRSSPTAARSTSPSASTSRPSGRNLGGGGVKQGAGIKPDVEAQDDPDDASATRRSTAAVRTVARQAT